MEGDVAKPQNQNRDELLTVAEKLARGLPFGRIDFCILPNKEIKLGEVTFSLMSRLERWKPEEIDIILGKKIILPGR